MATQQFFLNGYQYSHASLEIVISLAGVSSEVFINIDSIEYSDELQIALVRGTNRGPIGWTAGDYEAADTTISMGKAAFQFGIVRKIGNGWMGADIVTSISYADKNQPLTKDVIKGRLCAAGDASQQGPENNRTKVGIKTLYIQRDGKMPLLNMIQ